MLDQLADMPVNEAMILPVKIILGKNIGHLVPRVVIKHQPAQHGLLRFNGMRRHFVGFKQLVAGGGGEEFRHGIT